MKKNIESTIKAFTEAFIVYTEYDGIRPTYSSHGDRSEQMQKDIDEKVENIKGIFTEILSEDEDF